MQIIIKNFYGVIGVIFFLMISLMSLIKITSLPETDIGSLTHVMFIIITCIGSTGIFISYYYFDIMDKLDKIKL